MLNVSEQSGFGFNLSTLEQAGIPLAAVLHSLCCLANEMWWFSVFVSKLRRVASFQGYIEK